MRAWNLLVGAYDHVLRDKRWSVQVRLETCNLLKKKLLEVWPLILEETPHTIGPEVPAKEVVDSAKR